MPPQTLDLIPADQAITLDGLFFERVRRSGDAPAYRWHHQEQWQQMSWKQAAAEVERWRQALAGEGLERGARVAILLRNAPQWAIFDIATLAQGLVNVPLYTDDRPEAVAYILADAGVELLLIQDRGRWQRLQPALGDNQTLKRVIILHPRDDEPLDDPRVTTLERWLASAASQPAPPAPVERNPDALATLVYTSGTTGRPKGVMLSHRNILSVVEGGLHYVPIYREDRLLSFLPLSHTLERSAGHYLPMMTGASVAYARSITQLAQDFVHLRPSVMVAVPRVFERVYGRIRQQLEQGSPLARWLFQRAVATGWQRFQYQQGRTAWHPRLLLYPLLDGLVGRKVRARLGGEMRVAISGGAPLSAEIARLFIGLGVPILQGYGLTETAPVVSVNPPDDNQPASVGRPLSNLAVRIGEQQELLIKGPGVMLGYWNNPEATAAIIDRDGWLHSGDQARIEGNHLYITGRIKDILVLSNGEKVPPSDLELAIALNPFIDQVMVIGEGEAYLTALLVLNPDLWPELARRHGIEPDHPAALTHEPLLTTLQRQLRETLHSFPAHAKIRRITLLPEPWSIENGLLTPTLKVKRAQVMERYHEQIAAMYR